jgi:hypothetical protein
MGVFPKKPISRSKLWCIRNFMSTMVHKSLLHSSLHFHVNNRAFSSWGLFHISPARRLHAYITCRWKAGSSETRETWYQLDVYVLSAMLNSPFGRISDSFVYRLRPSLLSSAFCFCSVLDKSSSSALTSFPHHQQALAMSSYRRHLPRFCQWQMVTAFKGG